jgi:hypothetical protein
VNKGRNKISKCKNLKTKQSFTAFNVITDMVIKKIISPGIESELPVSQAKILQSELLPTMYASLLIRDL